MGSNAALLLGGKEICGNGTAPALREGVIAGR